MEYDAYKVLLRQSKWYNPFQVDRPDKKRDGTRDGVIQKYRTYLSAQKHLIDSLPELKGKV